MNTHGGMKQLFGGVVVVMLAACGGAQQARQSVGPAGGKLTLVSGLEVEVPRGAVEQETEVRVTEEQHGHERRITLEPTGLVLSHPARVSAPDDGVEIEATHTEHGVESASEVHRRGGRAEIEVTELGTVVMRHRGEGVETEVHGGAHDADGGEVETHGGAHDADGGEVEVHGGLDDADGGVGEVHGGLDDVDGGVGEVHGGLDDVDAGVATSSPGTGAACVTDDTCGCGSECVGGACTVVVTCMVDADCATGERCREGQRHGQACGAMVCRP